MSSRRVAIVGMFLESNAFARTVDERRWRGLYLEGGEVTADARADHPRLMLEVAGFYAGMDRHGAWEPVPIVVTMAGAGGATEHGFFLDTIAKICAALAVAGPLDAVYLCNHGAMITTEEEDGDGLFFAAVRESVGADVPLVATLDPHGNVSDLMLGSVDLIVAYRTDPHVDQRARGEEAADLLHEMWQGMTPHPIFVSCRSLHRTFRCSRITAYLPSSSRWVKPGRRQKSATCRSLVGSPSLTPRRTAWRSS